MHSTIAGLVLTGGGARGAYQAGVLRGIAEIYGKKEAPFPVISGASAGAINGSYIASQHQDFQKATLDLCKLWENLTFDKVVQTRSTRLFRTGGLWLMQAALGSFSEGRKINHLLDTSPLVELISSQIPFQRIKEGIAIGNLRGIALSTTNYATGTEVIFYQAINEIEDWVRANRVSRFEEIGPAHVLASASIPIFFPPTPIGNSYFGDGSIRMRSPLSPAIHLGAQKIIAIGVKKRKTPEDLIHANQKNMDSVVVADIAGVLLNALFLDSLDADLERLERINRTLQTHSSPEATPDRLRVVDCLRISPSQDLGSLAQDSIDTFPRGLKYLFSGIGSKKDKGLELLSYMAFEKNYTARLVQIGKEDAHRHRDQIVDFLHKDN